MSMPKGQDAANTHCESSDEDEIPLSKPGCKSKAMTYDPNIHEHSESVEKDTGLVEAVGGGDSPLDDDDEFEYEEVEEEFEVPVEMTMEQFQALMKENEGESEIVVSQFVIGCGGPAGGGSGGAKTYKCSGEGCGETFDSLSEKEVHYKNSCQPTALVKYPSTTEPDAFDEVKLERQADKQFHCKYCDHKNPHPQNLARHAPKCSKVVSSVLPVDGFICAVCSQLAKNENTMQKHVRTSHYEKNASGNPVKPKTPISSFYKSCQLTIRGTNTELVAGSEQMPVGGSTVTAMLDFVSLQAQHSGLAGEREAALCYTQIGWTTYKGFEPTDVSAASAAAAKQNRWRLHEMTEDYPTSDTNLLPILQQTLREYFAAANKLLKQPQTSPYCLRIQNAGSRGDSTRVQQFNSVEEKTALRYADRVASFVHFLCACLNDHNADLLVGKLSVNEATALQALIDAIDSLPDEIPVDLLLETLRPSLKAVLEIFLFQHLPFHRLSEAASLLWVEQFLIVLAVTDKGFREPTHLTEYISPLLWCSRVCVMLKIDSDLGADNLGEAAIEKIVAGAVTNVAFVGDGLRAYEKLKVLKGLFDADSSSNRSSTTLSWNGDSLVVGDKGDVSLRDFQTGFQKIFARIRELQILLVDGMPVKEDAFFDKFLFDDLSNNVNGHSLIKNARNEFAPLATNLAVYWDTAVASKYYHADKIPKLDAIKTFKNLCDEYLELLAFLWKYSCGFPSRSTTEELTRIENGNGIQRTIVAVDGELANCVGYSKIEALTHKRDFRIKFAGRDLTQGHLFYHVYIRDLHLYVTKLISGDQTYDKGRLFVKDGVLIDSEHLNRLYLRISLKHLGLPFGTELLRQSLSAFQKKYLPTSLTEEERYEADAMYANQFGHSIRTDHSFYGVTGLGANPMHRIASDNFHKLMGIAPPKLAIENPKHEFSKSDLLPIKRTTLSQAMLPASIVTASLNGIEVDVPSVNLAEFETQHLILLRTALDRGDATLTAFQVASLPWVRFGLVDVGIVQGTGGGKTFTWLLPALAEDGKVTAVFVPTKPLTDDMLKLLNHLRVNHCDFRGMRDSHGAQDSAVMLLSYEDLDHPQFVAMMQQLVTAGRLARFVFEEAACIVDWAGFRTSLRKLIDIRTCVRPPPPFVFVTATFLPKLQKTIAESCSQTLVMIRDPSSTVRPNVELAFVKEKDNAAVTSTVSSILAEFSVNREQNLKVVVLCQSKEDVTALAKAVVASKVQVALNTSDMADDERAEQMTKFHDGRSHVLIGTVAIALGINDPNIALAICHQIPHDTSMFIQFLGRAGRSKNLQARCLTVFSPGRAGWIVRKGGVEAQEILEMEQIVAHSGTVCPWTSLSLVNDGVAGRTCINSGCREPCAACRVTLAQQTLVLSTSARFQSLLGKPPIQPTRPLFEEAARLQAKNVRNQSEAEALKTLLDSLVKNGPFCSLCNARGKPCDHSFQSTCLAPDECYKCIGHHLATACPNNIQLPRNFCAFCKLPNLAHGQSFHPGFISGICPMPTRDVICPFLWWLHQEKDSDFLALIPPDIVSESDFVRWLYGLEDASSQLLTCSRVFVKLFPKWLRNVLSSGEGVGSGKRVGVDMEEEEQGKEGGKGT
ncbi:hypothetical protein HDU98_001051, partial [Podochytrium sp. JEL0797]